jgi:hypothetical protein
MSSTGPKLNGVPLSTKEEVLTSLRAQLAHFEAELATARRQGTVVEKWIENVGMTILALSNRLDSLQAEAELPIDILILHTFAKSNPRLPKPPAQPNQNPANMAFHPQPNQPNPNPANWPFVPQPNQGNPNPDPANPAFALQPNQRNPNQNPANTGFVPQPDQGNLNPGVNRTQKTQKPTWSPYEGGPNKDRA